MSNHVVGAVTQIQKTVFEFANGRLRTSIKDKGQNLTGASFMTVQPKSYLIVGNLSEFEGNDDKLACFELFRKNITSPEIVTFDELYERAKCLVGNLQPASIDDTEEDDFIPF